jgi:hypothetical protein
MRRLLLAAFLLGLGPMALAQTRGGELRVAVLAEPRSWTPRPPPARRSPG